GRLLRRLVALARLLDGAFAGRQNAILSRLIAGGVTFTAATTAAAGVTAPLRPRRAPLGSTGLFAASPTFLLLQVAVERLLFALPLGVGPLHFGDETLRFFVKRPRRLDQLA